MLPFRGLFGIDEVIIKYRPSVNLIDGLLSYYDNSTLWWGRIMLVKISGDFKDYSSSSMRSFSGFSMRCLRKPVNLAARAPSITRWSLERVIFIIGRIVTL